MVALSIESGITRQQTAPGQRGHGVEGIPNARQSTGCCLGKEQRARQGPTCGPHYTAASARKLRKRATRSPGSRFGANGPQLSDALLIAQSYPIFAGF